jgi:colicin import membrane protein
MLGLMLSMNWQTSSTQTIEAELWAEVPTPAQDAAPPPAAEPPPPPPAPEPAPEPAPAPEPIPEPPEPPPVAELPIKREPPKPVKPAKPKAEPKEEWVTDAPKLKVKPPPAPKPPAPKPPAPAPKTPPAPAPASSKPVPKVKTPAPPGATSPERERARQENLKKMLADLGGPSLSSAGPSAGYAGRIKARIKPNIVFTEAISGNPLAVVDVRTSPDGRITGKTMRTSSGVPAWDDAVMRAIDRTEVLPLDENGKIPAVLQIEFRPNDF